MTDHLTPEALDRLERTAQAAYDVLPYREGTGLALGRKCRVMTSHLCELVTIAEWDWTEGLASTVLHHVATYCECDHDTRFEAVTWTCGLQTAFAYIPGIFTRMGLKRCARCCARLGYPRGVGSPKNDPACRPLVDARLKDARHE